MVSMNTVWVAFVASFALLVWLNTNALAEYMSLFKLSFAFKFSEYEKLKSEGYPGSYLEFLTEYYKDYFIVRLVSCPICLSTWIGIIYSCFTNFYPGLAVAPLTLFFYYMFNRIM